MMPMVNGGNVPKGKIIINIHPGPVIDDSLKKTAREFWRLLTIRIGLGKMSLRVATEVH